MARPTVSCIGCSLIDYLFNGIDFSGPVIRPYLSREEGDGGLSPGKLVFTRELERFASKTYSGVLQDITGGRRPDAMNIGGPGIVSMIHLAQMLGPDNDVRFYGATGNDPASEFLKKRLARTPLSDRYLRSYNSSTPFTYVLSDPDADGGHGERIFINHIGAAAELGFPDPSFFDAPITVFGGTALVPGIHDDLGLLLGHAKRKGAFTVVNTVYDFRNQKENPGKPWPPGNDPSTFQHIDLLIMDLEEALKISGTADAEMALEFFISSGTGGAVITDGTRPVRIRTRSGAFRDDINGEFPVSEAVIHDRRTADIKGDTTGCGDNFVGGMVYSLAVQQERDGGKPDLLDALAWAVASGGFACFYLGGTYYEKESGEKYEKIRKYYVDYHNHLTG